MADNHDFEVVSKEVVFTGESPILPLKLFTVTGDILAKIVPLIKNGFNTEDAIISVGTQANPSRLLVMDTKYEEVLKPNLPVFSDLYLTVEAGEEVELTSGTVVFYCIYAKLSSDGLVEEVE